MIVPRLTQLGKKCNTNNHKEYFPIKILDDIKVDKHWFEGLFPKTKENMLFIFKSYGKHEFVELSYPHDNYTNLSDKQKDIWYNVYHCYLQQFNYSMYANFYKKDFVKVSISKSDLIILRDITKVKISRNPSSSWLENQWENLSVKFKEEIKSGLKKYDNNCFIKTEKSSAKNEIKLEPKYTSIDVLEHLTSCKEYYKEYEFILNGYMFEYEQNVIMMKWKEDFDRNREFRVIILDNKVKGISQQLWYKKIKYEPAELIKIGNAVVNFFKANKFYCKDITVDLIVDTNFNVELIECNPGGIYSSSGSSLFHWIEDMGELYDKSDNVYFKYCL